MRKKGIIFRKIGDRSWEDSAKYLKEVGFDNVFTGYKNFDEAKKLSSAFEKAGIMYESIHAPFDGINNIWYEGEDGEYMLARLMDCLKSCQQLDVPVMVVHLSSGIHAPCVNDLGHSRWDRLIDAAVGKNVTIAFENQRKIGNIAFAMELYKDIKEVGFCWDCGHERCFTPDIEYMPLFGKRLVYTHIHDNLGVNYDIPEEKRNDDLHRLPFDGNMDYNHFAELIRRYDFKGTLTIECCKASHPFYAEKYTPEQFIQRAYDAVSKIVELCDGKNS